MKLPHKLRILQVVGSMNRGGIETWLMHVLQHIDRDRFQIDFLTHTEQPCAYDEDIRAMGAQIFPCPLKRSQIWKYGTQFKQILQDYGPYDIVHSHVHHFSGYTLWLAQQSGIPVRVAHSHIDMSSLEAEAGYFRQIYFKLMRHWIKHCATLGLGCSREAAANLFGSNWQRDSRWQVFYCGINLNPFIKPIAKIDMRSKLGIPRDAFVIGHVGRFDAQKNHTFLIKIIAEVVRQEPNVFALLVGEGELLPIVKEQVISTNLSEQVIFAGSRTDIPCLMLECMDMFLLPSLHEGLPLVLLEAQAAGLSCIFSNHVTKEVEIIKQLMHRQSLSQSADVWANSVLQTKNLSYKPKPVEAAETMQKSEFNIDQGRLKLEKIYLQATSALAMP